MIPISRQSDVADNVEFEEGPTGTVNQFLGDPFHANRFKLVFVGDGYTAEDIENGIFAQDVYTCLAIYREFEPWDTLLKLTQVYGIDVVSRERGTDFEDGSPGEGGTLKDTYFQSQFWLAGIIRLLGIATVEGTVRVYDTANQFVPDWDSIVVLVNTDVPGGSGGFIAINSMDDQWGPQLSVHELGHSIGGLGDEYEIAGGGGAYWNPLPVNIDSNGEEPKWMRWIEEGTPLPTPDDEQYRETVGAFEGAGGVPTGVYRPSLNCNMRQIDQQFCPVCKEMHLLRVLDKVTPIDVGQFTYTDEERVYKIKSPIPDQLSFEWFLDNEKLDAIGDELIIPASEVPKNGSSLEARVNLSTPIVRVNREPIHFFWDVPDDGTTSLGTPNWWLAKWHFPLSDESDFEDFDGDGVSNRLEYLAGTNPLRISSLLKTTSIQFTEDREIILRWTSSSDKKYTVQQTENLDPNTFIPIETGIAATPPFNEYRIENFSAQQQFFQIVVED